jgi:hypothetical protein
MEGSLSPKRLNGIANQHNPAHRRSRYAGEGGVSILSENLAWRVGEWVKDQGLEPYLHMNDKMLTAVLSSRREEGEVPDNRQLQKVMVSCYNLDVFTEFVFKTRFCAAYEIPEKVLAEIGNKDEALLELGMAYLIQTFQARPLYERSLDPKE